MAFSTHDIVPDSPTNNFATFNPLANSTGTFSNGNLRIFHTSNQLVGDSSISYPLKGKYYSEFCDIVLGHITYRLVIIHNNTTGEQVELAKDGSWTNEAGTRTNGYLPSFSSSDVAGFWVDLENGEYAFSKNGSFGGTKQFAYSFYANGVSASSADDVVFRFGGSGTIASWGVTVNAGQDPTFGGAKSPTTTYPDAEGIGAFYYDPPTGALALCTANLPDFTPTVADDTPQDYFKAVTYTGSHPNANSVNVGFNPDLIWLKSRTQPYGHGVWDSIRTVDGYEFLSTNNTNAQPTSGDQITFITNGFRVDTGQAFNESGQGDNNMVGWCWKAGGNSNTFNINGTGYSTYSALQTANTSLPASSTSGMIVPSGMSINTDAGFSIVKYKGILDSSTSTATIPHGLTSADFCIIKNLGNSNTWVVSHTSIEPNVMALQDTGTAASTPPVDGTYGQITSLNSDTITITRGSTRGDNVGENLNSWDYIMYCWHSVEGYSKFGSFVGNGSADGPFVYCGFRPAFVMIKNVDQLSDWVIYDSARRSFNPMGFRLYPNEAYQESGLTSFLDVVSNGVKIVSGSSFNNTGIKYIFMAFAEQPFKYANAR